MTLSHEETETIAAMASSLPSDLRHRFVQSIMRELQAYPPGSRGPGLIHRLAIGTRREILGSGPVTVGIGRKRRR